MNEARSGRLWNAIFGALLGALIAVVTTELGLSYAAKIPFNMLLPGIVVGATIGATIGRRWLAAVAAILVALLGFIIYTPVASGLTSGLIRSDRVGDIRPDAIVVLSGGVNSDGTMGNITLDRVLSGIHLAQRFPGVPLLISREMIGTRARTITDSADMAAFLSLMPQGLALYFVDSTRSTLDEANRVRAIGAARGWRRIVLVTSPLHTRRACGTFEAQGFVVTCVPAVPRSGPVRANGRVDDKLGLFRTWVYEMAGTLKDRTAGRLHSPNHNPPR